MVTWLIKPHERVAATVGASITANLRLMASSPLPEKLKNRVAAPGVKPVLALDEPSICLKDVPDA